MSKYTHVLTLIQSATDPQNALSMKQYMRNQFEFLGVKTPARKALIKEFIKNEKAARIIDWQFVNDCYDSQFRELHYVALDYLQAMAKWLTYDDISNLYHLAKHHQWWDTIDRLDRLIGKIGLMDHRVDHLLLVWSKNEDIWLRRLAIDHQIGRKDKTNTEMLAAIILNNLGSDEFFINKAIGWSLREYAKTNPQWVRQFLADYQHQLSALSYREASKHLK